MARESGSGGSAWVGTDSERSTTGARTFFPAIQPESVFVLENVVVIRAALDTESDGHVSIAKTALALGLSHL
jgi:hypothetical protein